MKYEIVRGSTPENVAEKLNERELECGVIIFGGIKYDEFDNTYFILIKNVTIFLNL